MIAAAAALATAAWLLPIAAWSRTAVTWVRSAGGLGVFAFVFLYVAAALLLVPGSVLTLGAGFAYGPLWGSVLVVPTSWVPAALGFALARSGLRGWVERKVEGRPRFAAIDRAVGGDGFRIVLLLRLSPIVPYSLLNYALGLTKIKPGDYLLASALGMLPGTILYVYLGSLADAAADLSAGSGAAADPWRRALYWGGLGAAALVTVLITRAARRALRHELPAAHWRR